MIVPLVNEHDVDAVQRAFELERFEIVANRREERVSLARPVESALALLPNEVLDAPSVARFVRGDLVSTRDQLPHDTAEEVGIAVIPVGKQRVTKQRYAHTDVSSSRLVRRPPKSSR
jgi:hypothetical protein